MSTAATAETQPREEPTNQTRFVDLALRARTFGIVGAFSRGGFDPLAAQRLFRARPPKH